jgi:hypothetical protein
MITSCINGFSSDSLDGEIDFDYYDLMHLVDDNDEDGDNYSEFVDWFVDELARSSSSSSDNPSEATQQITKPKRIRKRRYFFAPRVVKRDIRRYYATMMANVFNSLDEHTVKSFLQTFAIPNLRIRKNDSLNFSTSSLFQNSFGNELISDTPVGIEWTYINFLVHRSMFPDQTMQIISSRLHTRSGTEKTMLAVDVRIEFTRMHDVHPMVLTDDIFEKTVSSELDPQNSSNQCAHDSENAVVSPESVNSSCSESCSVKLDKLANAIDPFKYFQHKVGAEMPRLETPESISFIGHLLFHINEQKQLELCEFVGLN